MNQVKIGIIGGTGMYKLLEDAEEIKISTPYGSPSDNIMIGNFNGVKVAFIPRHGKNHTIPPHKINFRANIYALKSLNVERIISPCAVGSLKKDFVPGDFVLIDQFIDFTKTRASTFYDGTQKFHRKFSDFEQNVNNKVCHISMADSFCPELRKIAADEGKRLGIKIHTSGTYICIEGPRFSSRAESKFFSGFADVIGMTLVPEVVLAREFQMCYMSIATITDYDAWSPDPVSTEMVVKTLNENNDKLKNLLSGILPKIPEERKCNCKNSLKNAFI